jgi:hypothetical protein
VQGKLPSSKLAHIRLAVALRVARVVPSPKLGPPPPQGGRYGDQ